MKYIKSAFLSLFFACVGLFSVVNSTMAVYCNATQNYPVRPYNYCTGNTETYCKAGCYCPGGAYGSTINAGSRCLATSGDYAPPSAYGDSVVHVGGGAYRCPDGYTSYNGGASSKSECYKSCSNNGVVRYAYFPNGCGAGYYIRGGYTTLTPCPAGKKCNETGAIISSCNDQCITGSCNGANEYSATGASECSECAPGNFIDSNHTSCLPCVAGYACNGTVNRIQCTGNKYSAEGASECSECTGAGYAVTKTSSNYNIGYNILWNTGCDICDDGTYANDGHTACENCKKGYACTGGIRTQCTGNTYTDTDNSTTCLVCDAIGYAVQVQLGRNVGCNVCPSGTYANTSHTACVACDDPGEYHEDGECRPCPDIDYNANLYTRFRISGQSGKAMCGIKLNTAVSNCSDSSLVQWHVVDDAWKLVDGSVAYADINHYVKDSLPNSPVGGNDSVDWCGVCPSGKFNIYTNKTGEGACVACPAGYCTLNNNCLQCKAGYYCPGEDGRAKQCFSVYGVYGIENQSFKCPKGSFSALGQTRCTNCAAGYTTQTNGTSYNPDSDDLDNVCQKIQILLNFGISTVGFPDIFKQGKMNASILSGQ